MPYKVHVLGKHCLAMRHSSVDPEFNVNKSTTQKETKAVDKNVTRSSKEPSSVFLLGSVFNNLEFAPIS